MKLDFLKGDFEITGLFTELVRWVFVVLAIFILVRAIASLLRTKNPAEVWAYMHLRTYRTDPEGVPLDWTEMSVPVTHCESVIGRSKSCDISVGDEKSRNPDARHQGKVDIQRFRF